MLNLANESNENCPPDLHYRGYYYDKESGFYYLQSRYYAPVTHRFINADSLASTDQGLTGTNMFAYCLNNPVRRRDASGDTSVDLFDGDGNPASDDDMRFDGGKVPDGDSSFTVGGLGNGGEGVTPSHLKSLVPDDTVLKYQTGTNKAPAGTVHTQISSDGSNTVVSQTFFGEHGMKVFRIDYQGRPHGDTLCPHVHFYYTYAGANGLFLNNGPILPYLAGEALF